MVEVSPQLIGRMIDFMRAVATDTDRHNLVDRVSEAQDICAELPAMDPDLPEARLVAANNFYGGVKHAVLEGDYDGSDVVKCCLAAIRRGRELARRVAA